MVNLFLVPGGIRKCHYKGEQNGSWGEGLKENRGRRKVEKREWGGGRGREENTSTKLETNPIRIQLTF